MSRSKSALTPPAQARALGEALLAHRERLHAFIYRRTGDHAEAEDLTQQAFLEALQGLDGFRGESQASTWLFGIALNLVRNYLLRSPRRRFAHQGTSALAALPGEEASPQTQAEHRQLLMRLIDALGGMPAQTRDALLAISVDGLSYAQAAARLGVPVGTVRSRVSRARALLRERVDVAVGQVP